MINKAPIEIACCRFVKQIQFPGYTMEKKKSISLLIVFFYNLQSRTCRVIMSNFSWNTFLSLLWHSKVSLIKYLGYLILLWLYLLTKLDRIWKWIWGGNIYSALRINKLFSFFLFQNLAVPWNYIKPCFKLISSLIGLQGKRWFTRLTILLTFLLLRL